jgi:hypothetical protein
MMELIARPPRRYHVSHDTVLELEDAILADPRVIAAQPRPLTTPLLDGVTRLLRKAGTDPASLLRVSARANVTDAPDRDYFAVMMELDAAKTAPWFIHNARKSIYLFDAWPGKHGQIRDFVDKWAVQYVFVSSSQAAERLSKLSDRGTFLWVPEGIDPKHYEARSFIEKDIDVLQLGRKYDAHHALIAPALEASGMTYLYEHKKGGIVFPTRKEFVTGLARTRISICVPSSMTHPERAGDVETMTIRYLQSVVSKCIILGHAPREMIDLFGYDPVIAIDMSDPAGQVIDILENYDDYLPLVERNFETVTAHHTWANRWARMSSVLFTD